MRLHTNCLLAPTRLILAVIALFAGMSATGKAMPVSNWHTDYAEAYRTGKAEKKMLLVFFGDQMAGPMSISLREESVNTPEALPLLERYVLAKLPLDATVDIGGEAVSLIEHASFESLGRRAGIAVVDLANTDTKHYGHVVTAVPFARGKYYRYEARHLSVLLDLPSGTLTQRTMIFAVRIHPETPASTTGRQSPVLADEADSHSDHQAQITVQGHHNWDSRFHRINRRLPNGHSAVEVVAESWPGEGLVDACVDCVDSWRQSPGHWRAVRSRHALFGYDIKRGRNGIWYATGIFGRRR